MNADPFPIITGRLTNECGDVISCMNQAVEYAGICPSENRREVSMQLSSGRTARVNRTAVLIKGYVTIFENGRRLSPAIPFRIVRDFCMKAPKQATVKFVTRQAYCDVEPVYAEDGMTPERVKVFVFIDTQAVSLVKTDLSVPEVDESLRVIGRTIICADRIFDAVMFQSETGFTYATRPLRAENCLYGAVGDGTKRVFTNADRLAEYGSTGILPEKLVSYRNLFVNGMLQPECNYKITNGRLEFETTDVPPKGQLVVITYARLSVPCRCMVRVVNEQYCASADGRKRIFTDLDALKECKSGAIPAPREVSCCNLFINGVLQPKTNYTVSRGVLKLTTRDVPEKGQIVTLESLKIEDEWGRPYWMDCSQYVALSNGGKIYTNRDGLKKYGSTGIVRPSDWLIQDLYVNGMIQPKVNYTVRNGLLVLNTEDSPLVKTPITLQTLSAYW